MELMDTPSTEAASRPANRKEFRVGTERLISPAETLKRVARMMPAMGITRVANITGLDRIGIPSVAVCRPNSRSVAVSQGKGVSLTAAEASGVMEAVEGFHAERVCGPLLFGSHREMRSECKIADVSRLPRLATSAFGDDLRMLWIPGNNMLDGQQMLVPYELVHTDFRLPLPAGSGSFLMSSNGLASGNHVLEAVSHAICEIVERDANTLCDLSDRAQRSARRVDLSTVDDETCCETLGRFTKADMFVAVWETTSDVGIPSFLCTVADRDPHNSRPMPPISGSGCHPRRGIALLRALTESAQGRLTIISGSRDDVSWKGFDEDVPRRRERWLGRLAEGEKGGRSFRNAPDAIHDTFDEDVAWELRQLEGAQVQQVVMVNLTRSEFEIPVVRVIVPGLEAMSEVPGYVLGSRARRAISGGVG
jgi:ribosomal protein S12 methylthiotransferase accessory factor